MSYQPVNDSNFWLGACAVSAFTSAMAYLMPRWMFGLAINPLQKLQWVPFGLISVGAGIVALGFAIAWVFGK